MELGNNMLKKLENKKNKKISISKKAYEKLNKKRVYNNIKVPDEIKAFCQHGFIYITGNETGDQVYGSCPFCGHEKHSGKHKYTFYINKKNHMWDCKSCKREGGFKTFIKETVELGKKMFKGSKANFLQEERKLLIKSFREWDIGYNINNNSYLIPIYDANKKDIWNLYYWKKNVGIRGTKSMLPGLYGWFNFKKQGEVWLCEGEFDAICLQEIFNITGKNDEVVVAVPSAGIFKKDWTNFFKDRIVNVIYDNDKAGTGYYNEQGIAKGGMLNVHTLLVHVVNKINYIHWPNGYTNGFDISDLYIKKCKKNAEKTLKLIKKFLQPNIPNVELPEGVEKKNDKYIKLDGKGLLAEEVYKEYEKRLLIKDRNIIDLMFGTIIGNRLEGDPIWLFMVAPPGGSKSMYIMTVSNAPLIYTLTGLTSKTLISGAVGAGGSDPSLLPLLDGKILVIKDFTTILTQPKLEQESIFGILRDSYDGSIDWAFGNGQQKRYKSHYGILAGVTPAIELQDETDAILGARFLRYNMPFYTEEGEQEEIIRRAIYNVGKSDIIYQELRKISTEILNYNFKNKPTLPENILNAIIALSQWIAIMRGYVNRQKYTDNVTHKPFAEIGTRVAKQLTKLSLGIAMFRRQDEVTEDIYLNIITKVARSTPSSRKETALEYIWMHDKDNISLIDISKAISLPTGTLTTVLEDLCMLNALTKKPILGKRIGSTTYIYNITDRMNYLIEESRVYKHLENIKYDN